MKKSRTRTQREKVIIIYCSAVLTERGKKILQQFENASFLQKQKEESRGVFWLEEVLEEELPVPAATPPLTGMSPVQLGPSTLQVMASRWKIQLMHDGVTITAGKRQPSAAANSSWIALGAPNPFGVWEVWPLLKQCWIINSKLNHTNFKYLPVNSNPRQELSMLWNKNILREL